MDKCTNEKENEKKLDETEKPARKERKRKRKKENANDKHTVAGPVAAFAVWCLGERRSYAAECAAVTLSVLAATLYPWELFGAIPLVLYSGKKPKRKRKKAEKYFYYAFYPAHLALLGCIKAAAGI